MPPTSTPPQGGNPRVIWMAMFLATFFYAVVAFVVKGQGSEIASSLTGWVLPVIAAGAGVAAFFFPRLFPEPTERTRDGAPVPAMPTRSIIIWAMDESVTVIGLVSVFLGAPPTHIVFYMLGSWFLLWLHRPRG